ncbi:hypothetical protein E2566_03655 [Pectobacterium punjabense]|uniref:Restriction endonuclease n=1 Tax=Pectobacterium punjabense TaxID=2108399 RepID=A0ABX6KYF9_9GAMM|nr:hypothetical protein [Pectobacterium punjabense]MBN3136050.1 hypothetical protein [Pectobacterium punjabense]MBS4432916.1 hypothetical protein [Pectobacterium punjabense]MCE5378716.1 hypothetical protein [Pectobacterium punjabense]PTA65945.1 hypothetical protein C9I36_01990 [Pectobacterium punjabense]QJA19090.1 hypothetical protein E2566_03655 [Pectobacterium punjabense]
MILGIKNRTENWTTVGHLFDLRNNKLIRYLMGNNSDDSAPFDNGSEARLELFWYGYRDYIFGKNITRNTVKIDAIYERFLRLFPGLQERVLNFNGESNKYLRVKKTANYSLEREDAPLRLFQNIRHTEIDIVIETRNKLYIGEVKDSQTFGAHGGLFLPHQLLRQYVMARILVDELGKDLDVVPFVIVNDSTPRNDQNKVQLKNGQVLLMENLNYLNMKNVFTWSDIE